MFLELTNHGSQVATHSQKGVAKDVLRRLWLHVQAQVAIGNGSGNGGHFLLVGDHLAERVCHLAYLVVRPHLESLI